MDESNADGAPVAKRRARWALVGAIAWLAVGCAAVMGGLAAFWPDDLREAGALRTTLNYAAFMCATFAFHAGVAMVGVVGAAVVMRRRRLLVAGLLVGMVCAGPEVWWSVRRSGADGAVASRVPTVTVMSMNVLYGNADPARVVALVEDQAPDVIVFQEWTRRAAERLRPVLENTYPHWVASERDDAFGQAVCSRRPFTRPARVFLPGGGHEPQITIEIEHDGRPLRITNVHTLPPVSPDYFREQRRVARELLGKPARAGKRDDSERTQVLAGDFNAVARSATIAGLRAGGWHDAHRGAGAIGRGSTWPRLGALRWVPGIRLDHVLHSDELVCESSVVGGDVGSDHAPVVARLRWAR